MYYTIALTFASILVGQTRWSKAHSENTFKDPQNLPRQLARKLPLVLAETDGLATRDDCGFWRLTEAGRAHAVLLPRAGESAAN